MRAEGEWCSVMWYSDPGWGGWVVMTLMMLVVWGALIFGGIALWRAASRAGREERLASYRSAEQLLDERFARGEIDEDEYARRRESLDSRG